MQARGVKAGAVVTYDGRRYVVWSRSATPGSWWIQPAGWGSGGMDGVLEVHGSKLKTAGME